MGNAIELSDASFDQEISNSATPVLVDFWAPWCGPCRKQIPVIDELSVEMADKVKFAKINVDENQRKASDFGISGIPALLIFKNGQLVERLTGLHQKTQLQTILEKHV
jgi:thioredoxin 1